MSGRNSSSDFQSKLLGRTLAVFGILVVVATGYFHVRQSHKIHNKLPNDEWLSISQEKVVELRDLLTDHFLKNGLTDSEQLVVLSILSGERDVAAATKLNLNHKEFSRMRKSAFRKLSVDNERELHRYVFEGFFNSSLPIRNGDGQ